MSASSGKLVGHSISLAYAWLEADERSDKRLPDMKFPKGMPIDCSGMQSCLAHRIDAEPMPILNVTGTFEPDRRASLCWPWPRRSSHHAVIRDRSRGSTIALIMVLAMSLHTDRAAAQSVALVMEEGTLRHRREAATHADDSTISPAGSSTTSRRCGIVRATLERGSAKGSCCARHWLRCSGRSTRGRVLRGDDR